MPLSITNFSFFKSFVAKVLLFFIGLVVIDNGISFIFQNNYKMIYNGPGRYNYIRENKHDCLIMGSSTSTCYYADILSSKLGISILNVGLDGSALIYSRCLLEYVLVHDVKPQFIFLNIDLFEFLSGAWSGNYYSRVEQLRPLYGEASYIDKTLLMGTKFEKYKYLFKSYKYNDLPLSILIKRIRPSQTYRRGEAPKGVMRLPIDEKTLTDTFNCKHDIDKRKIDLLIEIINVCKDNDIYLFLVESPLFYPRMRMIERDQKIEAEISHLADRMGIPFIRVTQETHQVFKSPELFWDVLHLNDRGAKIFSDILGNEIKDHITRHLFQNSTGKHNM